MTMTILLLVGVALVVILALAVAGMARARRRGQLREQFGPEYDRVRAERGEGGAVSELEGRRERREQLQIRELDSQARARYLESWRSVQAHFVDDPGGAVRDADSLVSSVMSERGYPTTDFEQRSADVSVDHPGVVDNYRKAHAVSLANAEGRASTDDLRVAMVHYRSLFQELLGDEAATPGAAGAGGNTAMGSETGADRREPSGQREVN